MLPRRPILSASHICGYREVILQRQLEALKSELGPEWRLENLQGVARTAIKLQRAQEDHWSDDACRRRLFRGG
jgi:hypothetical protein